MKINKTNSEKFNVLGIDVGGTFTDLIYVNKENNVIEFAKVPTSSENQAFGVMNAIKKAELDLEKVKLIVHGTTTTTNALLERKLSKTGFITTKGFRDVIELGRRTRPNSYGMLGKFVPIIPRDLRYEVNERINASGKVIHPLYTKVIPHMGMRRVRPHPASPIVGDLIIKFEITFPTHLTKEQQQKLGDIL